MSIDPVADAAYIDLSRGQRATRFHRNHVVDLPFEGGALILDLDAQGKLLGIEVLGASRVLSLPLAHEVDKSEAG